MKKRNAVAIATGNHKKGYNGYAVIQGDTGQELIVLDECDHRHKSTAAARTCAVRRLQEGK